MCDPPERFNESDKKSKADCVDAVCFRIVKGLRRSEGYDRMVGMAWRKTLILLFAFTLVGGGGYYAGLIHTTVDFQLKDWKPQVAIHSSPPVGFSYINKDGKLTVDRSNPDNIKKSNEADFTLFWQVWSMVNNMYVDRSKVDAKKMVDGAIEGMVASLGDPYTSYLPVEQNTETKEELGGAFGGVGLELGMKDARIIVISPLDGTPGGRSGIKSGDYVLRIQDKTQKVDKTTDGMGLTEAVKTIRGPRGTPVILTMYREGGDKTFDVELVRDTIVVKSATIKILDDGNKKFALLKLSRFGDRTQAEWGEAVDKVLSDCQSLGKTCEGMVLDLRNNPGGYLEGAVHIAGEFLNPNEVVVSQQRYDGQKEVAQVMRNGRLLKIPLTVLVNKGSASASEILSGALQDHKRAKVVGEQSFGKGSVQQPEDFPDGSGIHITIAKWLRPSGDWIDKKGITPDFVVKWDKPEDVGDNWQKDPQVKKAVEMLK